MVFPYPNLAWLAGLLLPLIRFSITSLFGKVHIRPTTVSRIIITQIIRLKLKLSFLNCQFISFTCVWSYTALRYLNCKEFSVTYIHWLRNCNTFEGVTFKSMLIVAGSLPGMVWVLVQKGIMAFSTVHIIP